MWDAIISEYFCALNGVKQWGGCSHQLLSMYIDPLLNMLSKSGYGCNIYIYIYVLILEIMYSILRAIYGF